MSPKYKPSQAQLERMAADPWMTDLEKHNKVIDRTYHLEEQATLFEEKMKVENHRLDDLERKVEKE